VTTVVYAVRRWPKRRFAAHICSAYRFLPEISERNKTLGTPELSQEDNIKMDLEDMV